MPSSSSIVSSGLSTSKSQTKKRNNAKNSLIKNKNSSEERNLTNSKKNTRSYNNLSTLTKNKNEKLSSTSANTVDKEEMATFVLWRRPIITLYYFLAEFKDITIYYLIKLLNYRKMVTSFIVFAVLISFGFNIQGSHLPILLYLRKKIIWCSYWLGLGIASSIGLGTGLHTFLLYLGPFIAQVTLAAYECDSLNFPEPPYPDDIVCPNNNFSSSTTNSANVSSDNQNSQEDFSSTAAIALASSISILSIMAKVRLESFMWGVGTAIGELPPYFMARASALSAIDNRKQLNNMDQDEELIEFEHLLEAEQNGRKDISFLDKIRLSVFKIIKKVGFWGILLCASIPNPLFDLAGITCGHFLVKFSTFFGATLIGKAIIKMHIQKIFVIFLFSQHHLDSLFNMLSRVPYVGRNLQPLFQDWLNAEKQKLHRNKLTDDKSHTGGSESILSWVLNKIVLIMVIFFVVSIINSLAQKRYKRLNSQIQHGTKSSGDALTVNGKKIAND